MDDIRGISDYLLKLWQKEESRQKSRTQPEDGMESSGSFEMFNDQQWKDQWYMVSLERLINTKII